MTARWPKGWSRGTDGLPQATCAAALEARAAPWLRDEEAGLIDAGLLKSMDKTRGPRLTEQAEGR
jgi:hypothetical protein